MAELGANTRFTLAVRPALLPGQRLPSQLPEDLELLSHSPELRKALAAFFDSLNVELNAFATTAEEVWASELVVGAWHQGRLIGIAGIKRQYWWLRFQFILVHREYQERGLASHMRKLRAAAGCKYALVFSSVLRSNDNRQRPNQRDRFQIGQDATATYFAISFGDPAPLQTLLPLLKLGMQVYSAVQALRGWFGNATRRR